MRKENACMDTERDLKSLRDDSEFHCFRDARGVLHRHRKQSGAATAARNNLAAARAEDERIRKMINGR